MRKRTLIRILGLCLVWITSTAALAEDASIHRLLYVATPGIRNYLEHGLTDETGIALQREKNG